MYKKLDGLSMDLKKINKEKLKSVFPECFSEDKLDIDKLLSLCGEYIDNDFEKYKFEWKGKSECLRLARKRSTGTLRPCHEESVNFDDTQNIYIEGDNLEVLKLLQTTYYNKVKMIYIDPPYNTGNDFIYKDDFADPMARYKEITKQTTKSNPETMGRFHTNWLNMMYPRLRLAANLLRDDGVIFISIDDNEQANLKKVCDEVFGEENFVANIIWQKKYTRANDAQWFSDNHDFIVCYAKKKENFKINLLPRNKEQLSAYSNPDNHPKGVWKATPLHAKSGTNTSSYTFKNGIVWKPPIGTYRRFNDETMNKMDENNEIWFGNDGKQIPSRKSFLSDVKAGVTPITIWTYDEVGHNHEANSELKTLNMKGYFDNPKPTRLLMRILQLSTNNNDIILDFFSGSSTTAHAVMQLNSEDGSNRKFIMVQLPEMCNEKSEAYKAGYKNICEIGKERIRRAGNLIAENIVLLRSGSAEWVESPEFLAKRDEVKKEMDFGFKIFKLDTSNFRIWDSSPIIGNNQLDMLTERMNSMIDGIKDDRKDIDVVYEIMLKVGISLDTSVQCTKVHEKIVYIVGDFLLMIVLFDNITIEDIEEIVKYKPKKIVCAETGFKDDSTLSNTYYVLKNNQVELKLV